MTTCKEAQKRLKEHLNKKSYKIIHADRSEMPGILSALDLGIIFLKTKKDIMICPTKFAEFLACGVPVVVNEAKWDISKVVRENKLGAVITNFDERSLAEEIKNSLSLNIDKKYIYKSVKICEKLYSLNKGAEKYFTVYNSIKS